MRQIYDLLKVDTFISYYISNKFYKLYMSNFTYKLLDDCLDNNKILLIDFVEYHTEED